MYRKQLPRVYQLRDTIQNYDPNAYFQDFDNRLRNPPVIQHFRDIDTELLGLDDNAWTHLKADAAPLLIKRVHMRGWQPFFDKLNEAKGWVII